MTKIFVLTIVCALQSPNQPTSVSVDTAAFKTASRCLKVSEQLDREFAPKCAQIKTTCKVRDLNE